MIVTSNDMKVRIYEKEPDIYENGAIKEYGIIKEILSLNITSEDIPKNLKVLVPVLGNYEDNKRFSTGSIYSLEFNDNIFMEFDNIDTALMYFKLFVKLRDKDITDMSTEYPEFFI